MAAFILVHTFRKRAKWTIAWVNEACVQIVLPTADIRSVKEQEWGDGVDFTRLAEEYAGEHPGAQWDDKYEWASSTKQLRSHTLTTIRLRDGANIPVIHSIAEVQNAANSALGRPH